MLNKLLVVHTLFVFLGFLLSCFCYCLICPCDCLIIRGFKSLIMDNGAFLSKGVTMGASRRLL